jgi:hypothetical protein
VRKTSIFIVVAVVLASLLSGCRHENSITGPPMGTGVLSGQVIPVGDLSGASPAGINVTYNGQVAVTDASGRFAFMGMSANSVQAFGFSAAGNVQLSFTRADGINATGSVTADASSVVVQLQKRQASIVVTGQATRELEGLITKISSGSITVNDASTHGDVTAAITSTTVIRKGNQTMSAGDLNVGDRVHVKASGSNGSLTATEILFQESGNGSGGGQTSELEGLITAVSSNSITVDNASTGGDVTAAITGTTVIRKGNTTLTAAQLKVGDRVHVKTTGPADSLTATEIILQNPGA